MAETCHFRVGVRHFGGACARERPLRGCSEPAGLRAPSPPGHPGLRSPGAEAGLGGTSAVSVLRLLAFVLPLGLDTFAVAAALGATGGLTGRDRLRVSVLFVAFEGG